jgi:hypothetical protein
LEFDPDNGTLDHESQAAHRPIAIATPLAIF